MNEKKLSQKVRELRVRNGFSQEELAEKSGLSLRTIQRIENGETEPRGDSLQRLAKTFNILPNELIEWAEKEDPTALQILNLSSLFFLVFPLLNILIPLILWNSSKDKVAGINDLAKKVLNFQTTWTVAVFVLFISTIFSIQFKFRTMEEISPTMVSDPIAFYLLLYILMGGYNAILILFNSFLLRKGKQARYFPQIKFLR